MVSRPVVLRAALGAVTALTAGLLTTPPAGAAEPHPRRDNDAYAVPAAYDAPLLVTIDALTPGEVPERGPVFVSGTVINRDTETWTGIAVYPFINAGNCDGCPPPITTAAGLVEAAETDPEAVVGNRITDVSDTIDELEPGEVQEYTIRIPRDLLPVSEPGVYWFGVHALGASDSAPDDGLADGRARTFLPYVPRGRDGIGGRIDTAIVVPLRYRIRHLGNGQLARPEAWESAFDPTGDLGGPLAFGASSGARPVSWLIDPAVPDAARRLLRGNPPRDLGPEETDAGDGEGGDDNDGGDGQGDGGGPTDDATEQPEDPEPPPGDETALTAADWLDSVEVQLRGEEVLALPYGDLDMSATPDRMPGLYPLSRERVGTVLAQWETPTVPVIASPGGYLDPSAIEGIDDDSTLLLTDRMFGRREYRRGPPVVGVYDGHTVAATSSGASSGGPGPDPRLGAVAFRQRVLAEASLRLLAPGRRHPLIVVVPRGVDGTAGSAFWSELDPVWLNLTTVADATDRPATEVDPDSLTYPAAQETEELPLSVFTAVEELIASGRTLQNTLADAETVAADVRDEALAGASYHFRPYPDTAAARLDRSRRWIDRRLRSVTIAGPPAVTLSSADGSFAVTVENSLDRTVTVRIVAASIDGEVEVDVGDTVVLAPDSRTTILLDAHSTAPGVHNVSLSVTDVDGTPLGSSVEVPIRSGQVSEVIWVILGVGAGLLLLAIVLRLVRRIRDRNRVPTGSTTEGEA
ncbi:DUF6049 family protein [Nocardioides bizhenqiangii]|uniref:DUF6049 family protein n=1 Tax=Nocardioides bizhenqiangii TaxID=3095076 RepID=A0ABZ0ZRW4_9ACTN|nr:DUF6049 family protein [Nocardioides sp. HM61]WQQ26614.1 DUF6049 family protein [Nocardioides sp. HM61]